MRLNCKVRSSGLVKTGLLLFFLLLVPSTAGASAVSLDYRLGFNGFFTLNRWTPVTITVENKGRSIKGHLEVLTMSGSEYKRDLFSRSYSMPVELPTNAKKEYHLTVLIESFTHPLLIRLKEGPEVLVSHSINLRSHYQLQELSVFVDSQVPFDLHYDLDKQIIPTLSRAIFLPEVWYGYDGVRLLVMPVRGWQDMNQRQLSALEEWVLRGGCLVAAGGINYGSLVDQRLRKLLPLSVTGIREAKNLVSLHSFTGRRIPDREPALLLEAKLEGARVILLEDGLPIISHLPWGRGNIFFLAFDFDSGPFREWTGKQKLWGNLLSETHQTPSPLGGFPEQKLYSLMIENLPLGFPSFLGAALILTLYLAPVLFLIKKIETRADRRWTYIGLMMAWVVLASVASHGFFFSQYSRQSLSCNQFTWLRLSGPEPIPLFKEFVGLYNIKRERTHLRLGDNLYPVRGSIFEREQERVGRLFGLEEKSAHQVVHLDLDRWSHRFFTLEGSVPFPVKARVVAEAQPGLVLYLENQSPFRMEKCWVYYDERFFELEPIPANNSVRRTLADETAPGRGMDYLKDKRNRDFSVFSGKQKSLFESLSRELQGDLWQASHSRNKGQKDSVYFWGWIAGAVKPIEGPSSRPAREAVTLVEWEIPVTR